MSTLSARSAIACWGTRYWQHRNEGEDWQDDRELLEWSALVHGLFPGFDIGVPSFWPLDRLTPTRYAQP